MSEGWYLFDCEFQTPTGLEGHPPVARGDAANRCSMKSLVAKAGARCSGAITLQGCRAPRPHRRLDTPQLRSPLSGRSWPPLVVRSNVDMLCWPPRADFHDRPERDAQPESPKIRLQSDHGHGRERRASALRARQGPAAAFGGALRAALTRARAASLVAITRRRLRLHRVDEESYSAIIKSRQRDGGITLRFSRGGP
jgi:hypothetical protein